MRGQYARQGCGAGAHSKCVDEVPPPFRAMKVTYGGVREAVAECSRADEVLPTRTS